MGRIPRLFRGVALLPRGTVSLAGGTRAGIAGLETQGSPFSSALDEHRTELQNRSDSSSTRHLEYGVQHSHSSPFAIREPQAHPVHQMRLLRPPDSNRRLWLQRVRFPHLRRWHCACSAPAHPIVPTDLDIDRTTPLLGTMATYDRHLLISTGRSDWNSKIELEDGLAAQVKGVLGKAGLKLRLDEFRDVCGALPCVASLFRGDFLPWGVLTDGSCKE